MRQYGVVLVVLAAAGCSSSPGNGTSPGELGRGKFSYYCDPNYKVADAQCNDNADLAIVDPSTNLPSIALGASFNVTFSDGRDYTDDTNAIALDPNTMRFVAIETGYAVLVGHRDDQGNAEDLVHVTIEQIDHIEFAHTAPMGGSFKGEVTAPGLMASFTVQGGPVTQLFRVVPLTKDRRLLAGALPVKWTSSDPSVVQVMTDPTQNIITVQILKSGTATLHVTLGETAGDVTLTVS
jgi:hypothetical protein